MTVSELQVVVGADTRGAESALSSLGAKVGSAGGAIATAFGGAALAGIAGLTAGLGASVAAATSFESQMSAVKAVSGATASEMAQLQGLALQLGKDTSFSAKEAAQGIEELVKAGISIGDVMGGAAASSLSLAAAGAVSVKDAAEIAANAMNQFGLQGKDLAGVADLIAGAANASAIDVGDFKFSLAAVGAVANTVGFTFKDTATAIALLGQAGIKGSDAGTSLKTMLLNLQPSTKEQTKLFRELGLITASGANAFFDASGKVKSMAEVAGTLQTALKGMTQQQKLATLETIFGSDAIRAAAVFANEGAEGFREMADAMGKVTADEVAKERLNNLKGSLEQLTGSLETAAISVGLKLTPMLKGLVDAATAMVNDATPGLEAFAERLTAAFDAVRLTAIDLLDIFRGGDSFDAAFERLATILPEDVALGVVDGVRQIGDAWRTMQQAMAGEWEPSAEIEGLASAAGNAVLTVQTLRDRIGELVAKSAELGTGDALSRAVGTLGEAARDSVTRLDELGGAIGRLNEASGGTSAKLDVLAAAIRTLGLAAELGALNAKFLMDTLLTAATVAVQATAMFLRVGEVMAKTLAGDMDGAAQAASNLGVTLVESINTVTGWADRTSENYQRAKTAAETAMQQMGTATQTGTAAAATATETNMAQVATATETNMTAAVTAVESAGPRMEEAAGSAARRAAAAVEAQRGAAEAAGQSVGDSIGSGLVAGIKAWLGSVIAAGAELAAAAVGAARGPEGADAHSPSRKMIALGQDMAAGLEQGLAEAGVGAAMVAQIRDFMAAAREYVPVAGEIKRVEGEIKTIRDQAQTEALFRAKEMVTIDSEALRLKQAQVSLERDLLPLRQDLARATREVADIERGSLSERTGLIEMDGERKKLRLQQIDLERQLIGLDSGSKKAKAIQEQIDKLREQDRALALEAERINLTNQVAATGARIRKEQLGDQARGQQAVIDMIGEQIAVLAAERAVFNANEAVIKNATDNEIAYRNQLIAVFRAEGQPILDRINAGLALVEQLEAEGKIGKEVADALRTLAKEAGASAEATKGLATAAGEAAPQIESAAQKVKAMTGSFDSVKNAATGAERAVAKYIGTLNDLPDGKFGGSLNERLQRRAMGGPVTAGRPYIVGDGGRPELFVPSSSGTILPRVPEIGGGGTQGGGVTVVFQGPVYGWPDFESAVIDAVGGGMRRGVSLGVR
jgi:TP901 family phage tail tape measure protein